MPETRPAEPQTFTSESVKFLLTHAPKEQLDQMVGNFLKIGNYADYPGIMQYTAAIYRSRKWTLPDWLEKYCPANSPET